ncbi:SOS response-associated peptidase [Leptospira langatensis]|nr:SOS response-associated peptidase [Leptospira langatensis]
MCGRFYQNQQLAEWKGISDLIPRQLHFDGMDNIGPTDRATIITRPGGQFQTIGATFWLIPEYLEKREDAFKAATFNAKSETIFQLPSFRKPIIHRRCLIPTWGFYEANGPAKFKQPWFFHLKNGEPMVFAGIYTEWWTKPFLASNNEFSFSIITVPANALVAKYHAKKRMPVILRKEQFERWTHPDLQHTDEISSFFKIFPEEEMDVYPVSKELFKGLKGDRCIERIQLPINEPPEELSLF